MKPKVSVCLITYNHREFITRALESIMAQQYAFSLEVVIGDDCSTDGTSEIINEFAKKAPQKIRVNKYAGNLGMVKNWRESISACKGEYVALIEGDDYWTDPLKLQKQVAVLDNNPHCSFACHDVETIYETGIPKIDTMTHIGESKIFTIGDILSRKGFIPTCSIVFRRNMLEPFPDWADKRLKCIDLVLELMLASKGPLFYINEKMGKYRLHLGGVSQITWLGREHVFEFDIIHILKLFNRYTDYLYHIAITNRIEWLYKEMLKKNSMDSVPYRRALLGLLRIAPFKNSEIFKGWVIHNFIPPRLYKLYKNLAG